MYAQKIFRKTGTLVIAPAQIGPYRLHMPLVLAPMAGVTDQPFRALCLRLGAGLVVSEMLSSEPQLWHSRKSTQRRLSQDDPEPRVVQIMGTDPTQLAAAAQQHVAYGAQIIDINMGCPAKKICHKAAGSALLRDEPLVAAILQAVVAAVPVPVTLKMRTGWDAQQRNALRIAQIAENSGIQSLAIHGRTRCDFYQGAAEYATIAAVKQRVGIPVFANGDITDPEKAQQVLRETGADGLLIGRAAQGNPWIFQEIAHFLSTGTLAAPPKLEEVAQVVLAHIAAVHRYYGEPMGVRIARKHLGWYLSKTLGAATWRETLNQVQTPKEQLEYLRVLLGIDGVQQLERATA